MLIESRPATDPGLAVLLTAQRHAFDPALSYLAGVVDGRVVACGGWQALGPGAAELKRLYVRPAFRGRGLARQLVVALEEEALAAGRPVLRLEVARCLTDAIELFRSSGYRERTSAAAVVFEKTLSFDEFFVMTGVAVGRGAPLRA
ncbi:GNAT family N-acetyltransferase [Actinoplanes sp. NPDC051494]|uniref:GNAT family N-acetyltransferase n=1 Tax=Actinoplanes sp. NPDC051494 TaxID=3363907 RepID=UPI003789DCE8